MQSDKQLDLFYGPDCVTVYLLHFQKKVGRCQHYIGSTNNLKRRLKEHRKKYPLYRLEQDSLDYLRDHTEIDCDLLTPLLHRNFRRKHTFLKAVSKLVAIEGMSIQVHLFRSARRHTTNGLVMAVNQKGGLWDVAQTWRANREFEMKLKRQKNARRFCPICQGREEELLPF